MRKRRAIILFSTLILLIIGYVAWCARPFYLKPPLHETISSPFGMDAEAERIIREWYAESDLITPPDFNWNQMGESLKRPWDEIIIPSNIVVVKSIQDEGRLLSIDFIVVLHGTTYYPIKGRLENGVYKWKREKS